MCGIAGFMPMDGSQPPDDLLSRMGNALVRRGPDGLGKHVDRGIGLVHRRLAVIDLKTGDQPLFSSDGTVLVANAEIYNYKELRKDLFDFPFQTKSDCEVVLPAYQSYGPEYVRSLRGMYAIAIFDSKKKRLILSRDPFGIKPLYYAETQEGLIFASEAQALIASGLVDNDLSTKHRNEFLQLQFSTGNQTIFANIKRVLPGETLIVSKGRIVSRQRLAALPAGPPRDISEDTALQELDFALHDSVLIHQRSDVPYGLFFSGGIDSTAILYLMSKMSEKPVHAYTAGFEGSVHDERTHAAELASYFGAKHVTVNVDKNAFFGRLPEIVAVMDDPAADYAIVPSFLLAERAARDLKVVLCGEGGDELFAGYGRHRSVLRPSFFGGRAPRKRGIFDGLKVLREVPSAWRAGIVETANNAAVLSRSTLQVAQAVDCADWLSHDLLTKVDRCLMYHSVEGRTPLLDSVITNAAFNLPDSLKVNKGRGKYLLRRWLADRVPSAKPFSRKRGFTVPVIEWISSESSKLGSLVAQQPGVLELAKPGEVKSLFSSNKKRSGMAAWMLLFYALWHQQHILGQNSSGSVFEVLSCTP